MRESSYYVVGQRMKGNQLLKIVLLLVCLWAPVSFGQRLEMLKITVQRIGPDVVEGSPEAKSKTIYRAGDKYARIEELFDPVKKQSLLIITREPESWMINVADNTATHIVDPGPTFNARLPIFWVPKGQGESDIDKQFVSLEFGIEETFFRQNKARDMGTKTIDGKECKVFAIKSGIWEFTLALDPETGKPAQIESTKDGKPDLSYRYIGYQTGLPFEPKLFEPPSGLKITEQSSSISASATPSPAK